MKSEMKTKETMNGLWEKWYEGKSVNNCVVVNRGVWKKRSGGDNWMT